MSLLVLDDVMKLSSLYNKKLLWRKQHRLWKKCKLQYFASVNKPLPNSKTYLNVVFVWKYNLFCWYRYIFKQGVCFVWLLVQTLCVHFCTLLWVLSGKYRSWLSVFCVMLTKWCIVCLIQWICSNCNNLIYYHRGAESFLRS